MLENLAMLENLSDIEKTQLEIFCQEKFLHAWEILFKEWEEATSMYFLQTWEIEISKELQGEKEVLWKIVAEDILGEMALFGNSWIRMATASAKENTTLIVMLDFSIKELTSKHPNLLKKIKNIIEDRNTKNSQLIR